MGRSRAAWRATNIALVALLGCSDGTGAADVASASPSSSTSTSAEPTFGWVEVSTAQPDLDSAVANHARAARDLRLVPIVHMRTPWNSGIFMRKHRDDRSVQAALAGFYLIEIDVTTDEPSSAPPANRWADTSSLLCGSYAQTFHAVDARGLPATPSASPGKSGPSDAAGIARMLKDFARALESREGEVCTPISGSP